MKGIIGHISVLEIIDNRILVYHEYLNSPDLKENVHPLNIFDVHMRLQELRDLKKELTNIHN